MTKVVKRMESFRTRHLAYGQQRILLLPLSFGVSSITLLHCLNDQLQRQIAGTGRTGYTLHILHVDASSVEKDNTDAAALDRVKERFPTHKYSSVPLSSVVELADMEDLLKTCNVASSQVEGEGGSTNQQTLERLISSVPSATSRADVVQILKSKLIASFAKRVNSEAIVWGDSTTRLAEKTLAETAKGRGFALPWLISDGLLPSGITYYYPLRDLLKKELAAYSRFAEPPLTPLIVQQAPISTIVSAKHSTIDDLMKTYFEGVEQNYPSIVANVVRTTSKLQAPDSKDVGDFSCGLCGLPLLESGRADDLVSAGAARPGSPSRFCHGCARSFPHAL